MSTFLDIAEELRVPNQGYSTLINNWNNDFFQLIASDISEEEKLKQLIEVLAKKRSYLDVSFQKLDYVSDDNYILM